MEREPTSEQLVAEMAWVRRLARALVRDAAAADDVAQDTWLIAAAQRPAEDRPLRPWLARVVLNLVRTRRRGELRRDAREAAFDADAPLPVTPAELIARVELQRVITDEVLALGEPYRSTVLLHFFEGISSAELAQRLGVPAGTVRRRLKVALDQLRAALERRRDRPERGWLAALVPLARLPSAPATPSVMGALAVKKLIAIAVVIAALAVGVLWKRHRAAAPGAAAPTKASPPGMLVRGDAQHGLPAWLAQEGAPPRRIAGRVIADGQPVAGATVKLALEIDDGVLQPLAEAAAGSDGAFDFGLEPPAVLSVAASAPKRASASLTVVAADPHANTEHLVLELGDCKSRLIGSVIDAGGGAIVGAHLTSGGLVGADSDANGHYSVCLAPLAQPGPQAALVRVEADGYGTLEQVELVSGDLHRDFVLAPEAVLVGRVTAGDQPVIGARVTATPDAMARAHDAIGGFADSDHDGRFRIVGLAPGKFQLAAIAAHLGTSTPIEAVARPAATSRDIHIQLTAFARVRGRVVMDGAPVAGAAVAVALHGQPSPHSSMSQQDGSFVLDHVPYGTVTLVAAPYRVAKPASINVAAASLDNVEIDVGKAATLRGHITRKGKPVPGAGMSCAFGTPGGHSTTADDSGAYVLDGLPAGTAVCSAWEPHDRAFAAPPRVQLGPTDDKTLDIELDNAGEVKGTVVDEAGHGVAGAYVSLDVANNGDDACQAMTDGSGAFDCLPLTGGDYMATVTPAPGTRKPLAPANGDHFDPITVPKDGATEGVRLAVKNQRLAIHGTVLDDTGSPVADVHVEAISNGRSGFGNFPSSLTDADGKFELADLSPGTYNLYAHAADGSETEITGIAAGAQGVTVTLARPGEIDGTLAGFSSTPVVTAVAFTGDLHVGGYAVVDGTTFTAVGLSPGHYVVDATAGVESDGTAVDVVAGQTAHVALTSRALGHVAGRVTELGTGAPVVGMRCDGNLSIGGTMAGPPPDLTRQSFTDGTGRFEVAAPVGSVRVFCFMPESMTVSAAGADVDVSPSSEPNVGLVAVRATYGAAPGTAGFSLNPGMLPITVALVDPHGPAAAAGLVAGDHLVTIDGASLQGMLPQGAMTMIMNHHAGSTIVLGVERPVAPLRVIVQ